MSAPLFGDVRYAGYSSPEYPRIIIDTLSPRDEVVQPTHLYFLDWGLIRFAVVANGTEDAIRSVREYGMPGETGHA